MATIVLGAVGTVLGGPVGGAIGALAGRAFDQAVLFQPGRRQGPRLTELQVQTSTYGTQIPRVFGTMRVAGTVIWATDLRETATNSGGGKGQPGVTTFSYAASFAVALSARRVLRIGRIWADGNLLRGEAGDFKSEIGAFRLHDGGPDQAVDPLIAAAEGVGQTPAHRGIAYALFEDLQLADYGNRIPSLTFEVVADDGPVSAGAIVADLTGGAITGGATAAEGESVDGYAASGEDIAAAIDPLVQAQGLVLTARADGLSLTQPQPGGTIGLPSLAARINGTAEAARRAARDPAEDVPLRLGLRHYAPARDYQAGMQTAVRPGVGRVARTIDLPAAMDAEAAKALAQARLTQAWRARGRIDLLCGWDALLHVPGSIVTVAGDAGEGEAGMGEAGRWRVETREWADMGVRLRLRGWPGAAAPVTAASGGRVLRQPDAPHGATRLMIAELPVVGDSAPDAPVVMLAAAGVSEGWRRAALFTVDPASGTASPIGRTAPAAVMGHVVVPPGAGSASLFDRHGSIDVAVPTGGAALTGADDAALLRGANLCLVGEELIQFGRVQPIGPGQYRLTHLLRGRRGTEWAIAGHAAGEAFLLIDADRLVAVPGEAVARGALFQAMAIGIGDTVPVDAVRLIRGEAMLPLAPVHLAAQAEGAGDWRISWIRRSRTGWDWADGVDAPLGEEREGWAIAVVAGGAVLRTVETDVASWLYPAADRAADLAAAGGGAITLRVQQRGTHGLGRPAMLGIGG
ncbi:phage tail baseplate protein [Sphingobium algorifonticola]|uniref:Uncharacterized protein n=1 Tax=Sphingobium algorifonticola TaxID=2008318 RepID=A0A437JC23_9SPHN|nr:phage tail protein [Sphingobium algorifonticola]RVT43421.1 hypothetical protein ENE74_01970 [Sphingobium algorifonticola]